MIGSAIDVDLAPTRLLFGWGACHRVAPLVRSFGARALIVTGRTYSGQAAEIERAAGQVRASGVNVTIANEVQPNPDIENVERMLSAARRADVIVAIGGGSVLDAAKVLAVAAEIEDPLPATRLLETRRMEVGTPRKRLIAVPTTAGTGSELSYGAIISHRSREWKGGVRGEGLAPDVAIVDPSRTLSMDRGLTAATGFDVLTHAFESYVSRRASAASKVLSLTAVRLVSEHLPRVLQDLEDRDARTAMAWASTMMGVNLRNVGTCLPHRLQYPIGGAMPSVSHPEALAWLYPAWVARLFAVRGDDVETVLDLLGAGRPSTGSDAADRMRGWLEGIGLNTRPPADLRVEPSLAMRRLRGDLTVDPIPDPEQAALAIYEEVW